MFDFHMNLVTCVSVKYPPMCMFSTLSKQNPLYFKACTSYQRRINKDKINFPLQIRFHINCINFLSCCLGLQKVSWNGSTTIRTPKPWTRKEIVVQCKMCVIISVFYKAHIDCINAFHFSEHTAQTATSNQQTASTLYHVRNWWDHIILPQTHLI